MDETPPGVLRDKLCKAREGGEYWRKEFIELREFTALEQQLLKVDMEAALVQENEFLKNEVGSLNLMVEKNAGFLEEFSAIFEEKRVHYTQMRSRGGSWTEESELLLDNVVATFDELSLMLETKNTQKADESFTPLDTSVLSTIEEGRESIDSSTTDRIRCKSMDMIKLDDSVQQHVRSSPTMDKTFPDDAEKRISELQKVSTLLNSEVAHCMSELDSRNNQITLLEHSLSLANQSLDTSSSELWSLCGKELESLEMTFHNSESNKDEFSAKLENVLSLVRKGVGELLSSPKCRLPPLMPECSSANESLAPLADSMYSQQLCSVIFESSVNASAMNMSTTSTHNQDLIRMANDVRSLRNCALNAMSDFSSEMFNAINHLLRLEAILQGAHDGKVSLQEPLSIRYKNALIQDFQDKANRILSSPYHPETALALSPCPSSTSLQVSQSQVAILKETLQAAEDGKKQLQKSLESNEELCESFSRKLMTLEEELEQKGLAIIELQSQLHTTQNQAATLEETLQDAKHEKAILQKSLDSCEELCNDFSHKLMRLKEELEQKDIALCAMVANERCLKNEFERVTKNNMPVDVTELGTQQIDGTILANSEELANVCTLSSHSSDSDSNCSGQALNSHSSMGVPIDDYYDVNAYNSTITFERSMFVSELPLERTMCAIDPLSLTIIPENVMTPAKAHRNDNDDDSGEETFLTPVSTKGDGSKSPGTPIVLPPNDALNRPNFLEKMAKYEATMDEDKELCEELQSHQDELICLRSQLEKTTADNAKLKMKLQDLVSSAMLTFYNSTNELEVEDSLSMLTQDMAKVQDSLLEYLGQSGNGLLDNASLLLSRLQLTKAKVKSIFNQFQGLLQDHKALKTKMEDLYSFKNHLSQISCGLSTLLNLVTNLKLEHEVSMEGLSSANKTLQATLSNTLLEKESLQDQLNSVVASKEELILSFEKKLSNMVGESRENFIQKNNLEKAILEVLQPWYSDELPASADLTLQLSAAFAELIEAKNLVSKRLCEQVTFNETVVVTCKELKNEMNCTVSEIHSLQKEAHDAFENISSAVVSLTLPNAQAELESLRAELEECHECISQYNTRAREHSSEHSELQRELQVLKELNGALNSSNTSLCVKLKEHELKTEELLSSNQLMSKELAKLQTTIINVESSLSETEAQLTAHKRRIEELSLSQPAQSSIVVVSPDFDEVISSMIMSSAGKPIDLKCNAKYETLHKLKHVENIISKSNEVLSDVFLLLDVHERGDLISLESLYTHLKNNNIKDMVTCKEKFAKEVHGFEPDSRVEELVKLSLVELQTRLVSAIMQKEEIVIADFQAECDKKLASKSHKLNQMEERVKYMEEIIDELTKSNEKLERALDQSNLKSKDHECAEELRKELNREKSNSAAFQEETFELNKKILKLEAEVVQLKRTSEEHLAKMSAAEATFELILQGIQNDSSNECGDKLHPNLSCKMREIVAVIFKKLKDRLTENSTRELASSEMISQYEKSENELAACRQTLSSLEAKLAAVALEIKNKDAFVARLQSDKANLELQIVEQKKEISCHEEKVSAALSEEKKDLLRQLETHAKYINQLTVLSSKLDHGQFNVKIREVARYCHTLKEEFTEIQRLVLADYKDLNMHFDIIKREIIKLSTEREKLLELEELLDRVGCLEKENAILRQEKESIQRKNLEQLQVKSSHDDKNCPHKDKVQECKRELLIIRDRADAEKKNFEIMKKNLQEDLEFKSSTIKSLEERNSKTVSEFMQRLAASSTSSNQLARKLEETEEKISLLREMHAQDKKRLEKDVENLVKENASLLAAKGFVESIGVDSNKIHESLPEIQKKLKGYQTLLEANEELKEQNGNLDEECETLLKQIRFLESRNSEIYKEFMEATEKLDELKKEQVTADEFIQKGKMLEEELISRKESETKMVSELKSLRNHLEMLTNQIAQEKSSYEELLRAYKQLESNLESRNQKMQQYITDIQSSEATIAAQTKALDEINAALDNEKAQLVIVTVQNHALQEELVGLKSELISYQSQLSTVGCQLGIIPELELRMKQLAEERDEALRRCQAVKGQISIAEKVLREKDRQIEALKKNCDVVMREKKEADSLFKGREKETMEKLDKMKEELSAKAIRIVELESVLQSSQSEIVATYEAKVSALELEVEQLRKDSSQNTSFVRPSNPVVVVPRNLHTQQESQSHQGYERIIRDLEKKITVLKRLCQQRRQKNLSYESILRQNNISIPNFEESS